MSVAQTVSNLAEQVQVLVQENRVRREPYQAVESLMKKRTESKLEHHQQAIPTFTAIFETPGVISSLTRSKSESIDPQDPLVYSIGLVTRLTPIKERPNWAKGWITPKRSPI
ncbi:hypothetical protein Adt_39235 [Abeliophyllum distichum]|uniref:Uncharacterized protein n=1 Tax=Abeliophyllum distichum TaxID=126358 RepID=A0ABD1Q5E4_9LAMI